MAVARGEGYGVVGFPTRPGDGLIKASTRFKVPRVPGPSRVPSQSVRGVKSRLPKLRSPKARRSQLNVPPVATGGTIMGASTSTTRVGY